MLFNYRNCDSNAAPAALYLPRLQVPTTGPICIKTLQANGWHAQLHAQTLLHTVACVHASAHAPWLMLHVPDELL
jgi:hypothetical protein